MLIQLSSYITKVRISDNPPARDISEVLLCQAGIPACVITTNAVLLPLMHFQFDIRRLCAIAKSRPHIFHHILD